MSTPENPTKDRDIIRHFLLEKRETIYPILEDLGLEIHQKFPLESLITDSVLVNVNEMQRGAFRDFLTDEINNIRQGQFLRQGFTPKLEELRLIIPELISRYTGKPVDHTIVDQENYGKANKEQGLQLFTDRCQKSTNITSSVDMYNNYKRWCMSNGFGCYSAPTLTKHLRDSDKQQYESFSEKGRSQGWYLTTP
jgi:hypothetical protein